MSFADLMQLSQGLLALLLLTVGLGLHHAVLGRPASGRWERLSRVLHLPGLALVLLTPAWWLATHLEQFTFLVPSLDLGLRFFGLVALFEIALFPLPSAGRLGWAVTVGARVGLAGLAGLLIAVLAGLPLHDPYAQKALASTAVVYLILHLGHAQLFKTPRAGLAQILQGRLWRLAYLLLLALVGLYLLMAWHLLPITRLGLTEYQLAVASLVGLLAGEALIALVFDYYFPVLRGSQISHLFRDLARAGLYLTLGLLLYSWSSGRSLALILADSAYFSVGIGLALKPTLGNLVAGLALRLSEPYQTGDWIQAGAVTGKVTGLTWRSTDVQTLLGDTISLPNAQLSRMLLINHSRPSRYHAVEHPFIAEFAVPPNEVRRAALAALSHIRGVLADPPAEVQLREFGDDDLRYCLLFYIPDYEQRIEFEDRATQALWYEFSRRGFDMAGDNRAAIPRKVRDRDLAGELRALLKSVDFLAALEPQELEFLQSRARLQRFGAGELICEQGQPGNSFYLIKSGRLRVTARNAQGEAFLSAEMQPGKYFGEMALLTGEPRSASVEALVDSEVFRIHKEDLRKLLRQNPRVEELISRVLARRQLRTEQARQEAELLKAMTPEDHAQAETTLAEQFLARIRDFFSY